jgi:hypothetical protein
MTTLAVTPSIHFPCHGFTSFRIGSKFPLHSVTAKASTSENDFECLASTGVKAPTNAKLRCVELLVATVWLLLRHRALLPRAAH